MSHQVRPTKFEATFQAGPDSPPTHFRVDDERVYKVQWIRDIRPATADEAPSGWLVVVFDAYSEEADETLTVPTVMAPQAGETSRPDWATLQNQHQPTLAAAARAADGDRAADPLDELVRPFAGDQQRGDE